VGLIVGLLTLPLAPIRGVAWVTEKVAEQAQLELYDESRIMRELGELDRAFEAGEMDEERYGEYVDELLARLETGRQLALERGEEIG
jgi:Gas vesicle protein G